MAFSLSTSWNAFRHDSGKALLFEIMELGFREAELSFNLSPSMVNEIEAQVKAQNIKVTSLHNFCPVPEGLNRQEALPDYYSMASCDSGERRLAIKYAKASIDTASRLGAEVVILHCGRVELPDRTKKLMRLYQRGKRASGQFTALKEAMIKERALYAPSFLQNTIKSLEELNSYATKYGILLGVETRVYYREIPTQTEIALILEKFKGSNIRYWHDTGHAQIMEDLGFFLHKEYLGLYGTDLSGIHLHDVSSLRDHLPPGKGEIDFAQFKPYLKDRVLKVIEAHYPASAAELKESKIFLEKLYGNCQN